MHHSSHGNIHFEQYARALINVGKVSDNPFSTPADINWKSSRCRIIRNFTGEKDDYLRREIKLLVDLNELVIEDMRRF